MCYQISDLEFISNANQLVQVTQYKYLRTNIENYGNLEIAINETLRAATKLYYVLNKRILNNKRITKKPKW